jgi:hypothetical protein
VAEALILPTMFAKAATIPDAIAQVLVNAMKKDGAIQYEKLIRGAALVHGITLPSSPKGMIASLVEAFTPASWSSVTVKTSSHFPAGDDASRGSASIVFRVGRQNQEAVTGYVSKYLQHFGASFSLLPIRHDVSGREYVLTISNAPSRAIEALRRKLQSGEFGR